MPAIQTRQSISRRLVYDKNLPESLVHRLWSSPDDLVAEGISLKAGNRCTVVRIEANGQAYVLKRYNLRGAAHTAAHACLTSRAAHCWKYGWLLGAHGINTPPPRAFVEKRCGPFRGRSYLLTEYVSGVSLHEALRNSPADSAAFSVVHQAISDLWRQLAMARLSHGDTKATNFLVAPDGQLWLIDLDSMQEHRLPRMLRRAREQDRTRFLRDWQDHPEFHKVFSSALSVDSADESVLWIEPKFQPLLQAAGLDGFDAIQSTTQGRMLRRLADRENWRLDLHGPDGHVRGAYLKRHHARRRWPILASRLCRKSYSAGDRCSEGRKEAEFIRRLDAAGIPTMTLIAYGERSRAGLNEESFIITEDLAGYTQLDEFLEQRFSWETPRRDVALESLIERVADVASRFHACGFNHRDFYCCHFFVREDSPGQFDVRLIDLQRVQQRTRRRGRWIIKDLAQLVYSAGPHCIGVTQKMRFIKRYLGVERLRSPDKRFIQRVLTRECQMRRKLGPYK